MIPILTIFGNWKIVSLYVTVLFIFFIFNQIQHRNTKLKIPRFYIWIFLLVWGIYIVQKSFSIKDASFYYIGTIVMPFFIFVMLLNINFDKKFLTRLFDLFILSAVVMSLLSLVIFIESGFDMKQRISSTWNDNNIFSLYLLFMFLINFSFIINRVKGDKFILYLITLSIILLGIILTQTRGVFISMIFAFTIYLIKRPKIVIPTVIIAFLLSLIFFDVFQDRFLSIRYFGSDVSSLGRLQAWLSSLLLIKENLLFGYGFNAYMYLRDQIFSFYFVEVEHSHNTYLRSILEIGLFGFLAYFSFIFTATKFALKGSNNNDPDFKKILEGLKLVFLACIPAFMFEPYFSLYGVSTITLWVFISITFKIKSFSNIIEANPV